MKFIYRIALFSFSLLIFTGAARAQSGTIEGNVLQDGAPLGFATIALRADSTEDLIKASVTGEYGKYKLSQIPYGAYTLQVEFLGLEPYISEVFILENPLLRRPDIELSAAAEALETIVVKAKRPLIEVLADKTVFNVQNTLNASGSNGLELLRKAPGVVLDNNNNVILEGKSGVQIFVNGKPSPLSGDDLTSFLESLQASDIDAIEIITQPSARFDAAGNAGIINIKLKKDKRLGTNGSINAGITQGRNTRANSGLNINNRTKRANLFGSYSNNFGDSWSFIYLDRIQNGVRYNSETETISTRNNHFGKLGYDFYKDNNHTFGVLINGSYSDNSSNGETVTPIGPAGTGIVETILTADNSQVSENYNINTNLSYVYTDTFDREFSVDLDYGMYDRDRISYQPNLYIDAVTDAKLFERNYRMITPIEIDIFTAQTDYKQKLWKGTFRTGLKFSYIQTDNTFDFFDVTESGDVKNEQRSNRFVYTENINAAYISFNRRWQKWNVQLGLRAEQTNSEGDLTSVQEIDDRNVKRNYLNWFPSGGLTYSPSRILSWALSYSRRILRPNYQTLNPFERQLDELSFSKGNPFLQPQYTNTLKLSNTYKYKYTTSLSFSHIQDFFGQVTDTLGQDKNFLITRNIADQYVWNLGFSLPFNVNKWWSVYTNINASHNSYRGNDEKFVSIDQTTASIYLQNTFYLSKGWKLELSGWASSPSVWGGTYLTKSMGALNIAVQKKFLNERLTARLGVNDIFFTSPWIADLEYSALTINGTGGWESRNVRLNLTYNFGGKEVKQQRKRKTGIEEEAKRVD